MASVTVTTGLKVLGKVLGMGVAAYKAKQSWGLILNRFPVWDGRACAAGEGALCRCWLRRRAIHKLRSPAQGGAEKRSPRVATGSSFNNQLVVINLRSSEGGSDAEELSHEHQ